MKQVITKKNKIVTMEEALEHISDGCTLMLADSAEWGLLRRLYRVSLTRALRN
jgi:hypothetical protein